MQLSSSFHRAGERSRPNKAAIILTIALHIFVIVLLLLQKGEMLPVKVEQTLTAFLLPEAKEKADSGDKTKAKAQTKAGEKAPVEKEKRPQPAPPVPAEKPAEMAPSFLNMTRAEFAAADIGKMASSRKQSGDSGDGGATAGAGDGPGGVRLYNADWYRRPPTHAELDGYLPPNAPRTGWGMIACRTVENYRVEDCQTIGESPLGSGLGKSVLQASWQFRVLPPRVNGRLMIGEWVRITIIYSARTEPG